VHFIQKATTHANLQDILMDPPPSSPNSQMYISWFSSQEVCTPLSSGLLRPPCGFMNRPSLIWVENKLYPPMLREAEEGDEQMMFRM